MKNIIYFPLILFLLGFLPFHELFSQNLITNGSFELGGPGNGFIVDGAGYNYITPPYAGTTNGGDFAVNNNPVLINTIFISGGDNTTGTGNMLMIDGNPTGGQQRFYKAGDTGGGVCGLTVGQAYTFRYFIKSISTTVTNTATQAEIGVQFNNVSSSSLVSGSPLAPLPAAGWQEVVYTIVPSFQCVNIELFNNNTSFVGNDFAIDDVALFPPPLQVSLTYSTSSLNCQTNSNFIAGYAFQGAAPFTFNLSGAQTASNNTGYFPNLPNGNYTLSVTDNLGSTAQASNITLNSTSSNASFITQDTTICAGQSVTLQAQNGGANYNWSSNPNDNNINFTNDSTAIVSPSLTTTYTLNGGNPNNNLIYNGSFQFGSTGFFTQYNLVAAAPAPGGAQGIAGVVAMANQFFAPFAACPDQDANNAMLVVDAATTNAILWQQAVPVEPNTNYTFSFWATAVVTANPAQLRTRINNTILNTTTLTSNVCAWQQISFIWNSGPSTIALIDITDLVLLANGNDFAIDNISFQSAVLPCADSITVSVVNSEPIVIPATYSVCQGGNVQLTPNGGSNLQWTLPDGSTVNAPNLNINNAMLSASGIYSVSSTDPNACFTPAQTTLTVNANPTINTSLQNVLCNGQNNGSVSANALGNAPFSFVWSNGQSGSNINNLQPGVYSVIVQDANNCIAQSSVTITEPPILNLNVQTTSTDCNLSEGSATANITGGTQNYNIVWSNGQTSTTNNNLAAGNYSVNITDQNNCQVNQNFTISTTNGPTVLIDQTNELNCFGDSDGFISLNVSGGTPSYSYNWQPNVSSTNTANTLSAGSYSITVTDAANCSQTFNVIISQPEAIAASINATNPTCGLQNGVINIVSTGGISPLNYSWSPNVGVDNNATNLLAGNYAVTITDNNGCTSSINQTLVTSGTIPLTLTPSTQIIEPNSNIELNANIAGGITDFDISWSPDATLSCSDCTNPTASPDGNTTYIVTVTTSDGCIAIDSVRIIVEKPCNGIALPTIFSPNGDGLHDELCMLEPQCVSSVELMIFNRLGELVFKTNNPYECWDGTFRNRPAMMGVYAYQLSATSGDQIEIISGTITLVR
jgi:gliding motility-associated-like protein